MNSIYYPIYRLSRFRQSFRKLHLLSWSISYFSARLRIMWARRYSVDHPSCERAGIPWITPHVSAPVFRRSFICKILKKVKNCILRFWSCLRLFVARWNIHPVVNSAYQPLRMVYRRRSFHTLSRCHPQRLLKITFDKLAARNFQG